MRFTFILFISLLCQYSFVSCQPPSEDSDDKGSSESSNKDGDNDDGTDNEPSTELPDPAPGTGQLNFTIEQEILDGSVSGYIVGEKGTLDVESLGDVYYINDIPPGSPDVIVTAGSLNLGLVVNSDNDLGQRFNAQAINADGVVTLGPLELPVAGSISGQVTLADKTDHAGIDVYIPGTDYLAKTDVNGSFAINNIPVGIHKLFFESDGYLRGELMNITVATEANTETDPVELAVSTGVTAQVTIGDGSGTLTELATTISIVYSEDTTLMMISEDSTFADEEWQPVSSSANWEFSDGGDKTLYFKFSNDDGVESTVSADVFISLLSLFFEDRVNLAFDAGQAAHDVAAGDFNGDGLLDIVGCGDDSATVFLNTTTDPTNATFTESFEQLVDASAGEFCYSVHIGDFDEDTNLDIALRPWSIDVGTRLWPLVTCEDLVMGPLPI